MSTNRRFIDLILLDTTIVEPQGYTGTSRRAALSGVPITQETPDARGEP